MSALACLPFAIGAQAQTPETPERLVRTLYEVHLAERAAGREGVVDVPVLRRRFLTPALGAALARNREASRQAGELLDDTLTFDPITSQQEESEMRDLRIQALSAHRDRAIVQVALTHFETQRVELNYILARANGVWRVHDILKLESQGDNNGWSLRRLLRMQG